MSQKEKLNILIATAFPVHGAGSGALVTTQAEGYVKEGHNVTIITANNRTNYPKVKGVKYHTVPFTGETENPEKIEGQCAFNYLMFTTHTESTATFWNASFDKIKEYEEAFRRALQTEIEESKPNIIHAQHNWLLSAQATEFDIPVVTTIHGTDLMGYERSFEELQKIKRELDRPDISKERIIELKKIADKYNYFIDRANLSARNSKKIIVISEAQKEKFCKLFPKEAEKVELIKNGYSPEKFHVIENVNKKEVLENLTTDRTEDGKIPMEYDKMVLFVGKFAQFKGIDVLLDATKIYEQDMQKRGKEVLTVIVGTGALEKDLKEQAKQLQLKNTHFVGLQTPEVICPLQNLCDVSLIPSREEPFGLVVIEGTACGHPVIGTNGGGIPDILNTTGKIIKKEYNKEVDSKNEEVLKPDEGTRGTYTTNLGILVPVDDAQALAEAVEKVLTGEKQFDNKAIAEYTENTYSQNVISEHIVNLFRQVIEEDKMIKQEKSKQEKPEKAEGWNFGDL